jgi:S-adenosylmethionine:tRNA ribosyltransferase-isomerase
VIDFAARLAPYGFDLPDDQIAREPLAERDAARLLTVCEGVEDRWVRDLPALLQPGDLLVVNDVRVRRARLRTRRASGGEVEVLLVGAGEALCRPGRRLRDGELLRCGDAGSVVLEQRLDAGRWRVRCEPDADTLAEAVGELPLPPYLGRTPSRADDTRYQTVFARRGDLAASAAPTAGLHFTPRLLEALEARGIDRASVTLEVGLGTFKPLTEAQLLSGELHPERFVLPEPTWEALQRARRVVAVGTTVARVLESAAGPGPGTTRLFIREGHPWRRVDVLFTNFHLPCSSLLMLVCAFAGRERTMAAYRHAVSAGYRFFSYGDASLFERAREDATR